MTISSATVSGRQPAADPAPPPAEPPSRPATGGRAAGLARRAYAAIHAEALLIALLAGSFLTRLLLADRDSYWHDELLSVLVYGRWHDSAVEAVQYLGNNSVHPPLYQFVLYNWMELVGDSERATRTLSNLYVTLATLFLYLLLRDALSRRVALLSALAFALLYTVTYYGLETRSYAQTLLLVTLSSYLLLRLMRTGTKRGWRPALLSPTALLFTATGIALLLTHYYNAFFWTAQGVLAVIFVLRERAPRRWLAGLGTVAALYATQAAVFGLIWGNMLLETFDRRSQAFAVEDSVRSPAVLFRSVVRPNLDPPRVVAWLGVAVALVVLVRAGLVLARRTGGGSPGHPDDAGPDRLRAWTVVYLGGWLLMPLLVSYLAFKVTGVARYSPRYWLFIVPPLAPLLVLVIDELGGLVGWAWHRVRGSRPADGWTTMAALALIPVLLLPGTVAGIYSTGGQHDWRGIARDIVNVVESDPQSRYLVIETSFSERPMLDYYLGRYSDDVRVGATISRRQEAGVEPFPFARLAPTIRQHDYVLVAFTHNRADRFPRALQLLGDTYPRHHTQVNHAYRGFVIFSVAPSAPPSN